MIKRFLRPAVTGDELAAALATQIDRAGMRKRDMRAPALVYPSCFA